MKRLFILLFCTLTSFFATAQTNDSPFGDVNKDGVTNSADVVAIYNYIITGEKPGLTIVTDLATRSVGGITYYYYDNNHPTILSNLDFTGIRGITVRFNDIQYFGGKTPTFHLNDYPNNICYASNITSIDLDITGVECMSYGFSLDNISEASCSHATTIKLSGCSTVTNWRACFAACNSLTSLYIDVINPNSTQQQMFVDGYGGVVPLSTESMENIANAFVRANTEQRVDINYIMYNNLTQSIIDIAAAKNWYFYYNGNKVVKKQSDDNEDINLSCPDDHHPHLIDLGLPSGTKWACCNVGASAPEGYGDYYSWGETETKSSYATSDYKYYNSSTGYTSLASNIAGTEFDVASTLWGNNWKMPTSTQCEELVNNTESEWVTIKGINGRIFTGSNGSSIFLPVTGHMWYDGLTGMTEGDYWSATQGTGNLASRAFSLSFYDTEIRKGYYILRDMGLPVRPVKK